MACQPTFARLRDDSDVVGGWYGSGMKATIDKAGRLVVPAELREQIGLRPGVVDIVVSGSGLRIEFPTDGVLVEEDGLLLIESAGETISDESLRNLRFADQA